MTSRLRHAVLPIALLLSLAASAAAQSYAVSTGNSTTATLGIGAVFTGAWEDIGVFASISVLVKADQASAANGLVLQFSPDGTNADYTESYTVVANVGQVIPARSAGRFFRVVYTNGGTGQGAFRLQTIFRAITPSTFALSADPCLNPNIPKIAKTLTATGEQVALTTGQTIYVCGFYATLGGTAPTVKLQYGTGTNCGTGSVDLTGAFAPAPNGTPLTMSSGGTIAATAVSNALCIVLAGTTPTIAGLLTYVKQ
jgi:hypothetical protein